MPVPKRFELLPDVIYRRLFIAHWFIGKELLFHLLTLILPLFSIIMLHNGRYYKFKNPFVMLTGLMAFSMIFINTEFNTLQKHILTALWAILPLAFAGVLHMIVVKKDLFQQLAIPINQKLLGASKTWRGVLVMPLFAMLGFYAISTLFTADTAYMSFDIYRYTPAELGLMLGFAYVAAELPNSFIKRRMGIPAGELPQKNRALFIAADQST